MQYARVYVTKEPINNKQGSGLYALKIKQNYSYVCTKVCQRINLYLIILFFFSKNK